jgi:hypothetical protein
MRQVTVFAPPASWARITSPDEATPVCRGRDAVPCPSYQGAVKLPRTLTPANFVLPTRDT